MTSVTAAASARSDYGRVAVALHWATALLIALNLYLGWRMGFLKGMSQFGAFQLHKSVGLTVLLLSLGRLGWRLANPPPPLSPELSRLERRLAEATHAGFYALLVGLPLTGWIVVSTSTLNIPTSLYHLLPWPWFPGVHDLPAGTRSQVNHLSSNTHVVLAFAMAFLLALHLAAVVKHQFDGHPVLRRMWPLPSPAA